MMYHTVAIGYWTLGLGSKDQETDICGATIGQLFDFFDIAITTPIPKGIMP